MVSPVSAKDQEQAITEPPGILVGKLALKQGFLNEEQFQKALTLHKNEMSQGREVPFGELLVFHGLISRKQLEFLLYLQRLAEVRQLDLRFGVLAVTKGYVTEESIEHALEEQKKVFKETRSIRRIGDILVQTGVLKADQRDAILLMQKDLQKEPKEPAGESAPPPTEGAGGNRPETPFELKVSDDRLEAWIHPRGKVPEEITAGVIKAFLAERGIRCGIAEDSRIEDYLKGNALGPWKIAQGSPPRSAEWGEAKYHFDTDPLKVGKIKEGDSIDFKDRGAVPYVKKGDLLAERGLAAPGVEGMDIYGQTIPIPSLKAPSFRKGKGTKISEDGLKVQAQVDGRPEKSADGRIYVFPEFQVNGDVDLKTGHVDFGGDVVVSGTVQSGFRVKAGGLRASEILKAEVETDGDVAVYGGIMGAKITTKGSLRAMHLEGATIEALGDVVVENEIIDSRVEAGGACIVKKGSILSSQVTAMKGVEALAVGSEATKPCVLVVGTNERVRKEIDRIKKQIVLEKDAQEKVKGRIKDLEEESSRLLEKVGGAVQGQDRANVVLRNLREKVNRLRTEGNPQELQKAEAEIKELDSRMKEQEGALETYLNRQDQIAEEVARLQQDVDLMDAQIRPLFEEMDAILQWLQSIRGVPEAKILGTIAPDTAIRGPHASLILPEGHSSVLVKEVMVRDSANNVDYKIRLLKLKGSASSPRQ